MAEGTDLTIESVNVHTLATVHARDVTRRMYMWRTGMEHHVQGRVWWGGPIYPGMAIVPLKQWRNEYLYRAM